MRKRISFCFIIGFATVFGAAACAGGEQQEIEILEERVGELEEDMTEIQLLLGTELEEEPQQEQTQPEQTQPEQTQ